MKNRFLLSLTLTAMLALTACGADKDTTANNDSSEAVVSTETEEMTEIADTELAVEDNTEMTEVYDVSTESEDSVSDMQSEIDKVTKDPDEWLAEQEKQNEEDAQLAQDILNQWIADQNKDKDPSGGGNGGSSNNGGGTDQQTQDAFNNANGGQGGSSVDVDDTKDSQGDAIGKGSIGG